VLPSVVDSVTGGVVTVTGSGFSSAGELLCVVGAGGDMRNSTALYVSNTQVECQVAARPSQNASFYAVSGLMTSNVLILSFQDPFGFQFNSTMFPTVVRSMGGTVITLTTSFPICKQCQFLCDFRGIKVQSVRVPSSSSLTCQTPPLSAGSMLLTLLSNDHVVSTFDMMVVEKQSFGLHSLHPQAISEGMQILIAGDGFHVGCVARLFNGSTLSTEILSEELLRVHVPSLPVGTWDVIVVSPLDFRNETLSVVVGHSPQIFSLQPTAVRLSSAAHVTVAGQGFLRIHTICVIDGENAVRTVWISGTQVVCFVPQLLPGIHSVSVGHNNVQQSTAVVFEVIGRTTVSKMAPSELVVRSFKGSSAITLIGSGFMRNMIFMVNELGCFSEFLSS
jgi:hypothetical protein